MIILALRTDQPASLVAMISKARQIRFASGTKAHSILLRGYGLQPFAFEDEGMALLLQPIHLDSRTSAML